MQVCWQRTPLDLGSYRTWMQSSPAGPGLSERLAALDEFAGATVPWHTTVWFVRPAGSPALPPAPSAWTARVASAAEAAQAGSGSLAHREVGAWRLGWKTLEVAQTVLTGWRLRRWPGGNLDPLWWAPLLRLALPLALSVHFEPLSPAEAMRGLGRRIRDYRSQQHEERAGGTPADDWVEAGLPAALALRRSLVRNEARVFRCSLWASLAASGEELPEAARRFEGAAQGLGLELVRAGGEVDQAWAASLPLGWLPQAAPEHRLVDSNALATLYPWPDPCLYEAQGDVWGQTPVDAGLAVLDRFDRQRYENGNLAVLASSGGGKTYLLGGVILAGAARGVPSIVLDPEDEHRSTCLRAGGAHRRLVAGETSLNPFALLSRGSEERLATDLPDVVELIAGALSSDERALVARLALSLGAEGDLPALQRLLAGHRLAESLEHWVQGPLSGFFSGPCDLPDQPGTLGLGLRELPEEMLPVVAYLLAQWSWDVIRRHPGPRNLVVDECGLLLEHPAMARFLVRLARRVRKYGATLVVATQNAGDLLATEGGTVIATNPAFVFLGLQRAQEASRLQRAYDLSPTQREHLITCGRGQGLLIAGRQRAYLEVSFPAWQRPQAAPPS